MVVNLERKCKFCGKIIPKGKLDNWTYARRTFCNHKCNSGFKKTIKHTYEYKRKMSEKLKGRKITWNDKLKGRKMSDETKRKIRKANTGRKFNHTQEVKEKMSKARKGKRIREKNPNWKGGGINHDIRTIIERLHEYRLWHSDVLKRDLYTCNNCFSKSNKANYIIVHHIKKLSVIIAEYNIKNINDALNCPELFDINNGIVYCQNCHKLVHKGKK